MYLGRRREYNFQLNRFMSEDKLEKFDSEGEAQDWLEKQKPTVEDYTPWEIDGIRFHSRVRFEIGIKNMCGKNEDNEPDWDFEMTNCKTFNCKLNFVSEEV